jgi:hypothetical protein
MGLYIYILENDREEMRKVKDNDVNRIFQEALEHDKSLLIRQSTWVEKTSFWGKKTTKEVFSIFHDCNPNQPPYQARQQLSGSGSKAVALAYLYGIINGFEKARETNCL